MRRRRNKRQRSDAELLIRDAGIVFLSILIAIILVKTGTLNAIITKTHFGIEWLESFIAGIFFTSVFTTAPAIVALAEIAKVHGIWETAFWGALGSVVGDLVIFQFVKDQLGEHMVAVLSHQRGFRRLRALGKYRSFRTFTFILGGLILASPFPDELGIALLGFSRMRTAYFVPLAFFFNFLGILAIGWIATH